MIIIIYKLIKGLFLFGDLFDSSESIGTDRIFGVEEFCAVQKAGAVIKGSTPIWVGVSKEQWWMEGMVK